MALEEEIILLLKQQHKTFCTAESCTGGEIAARLTKIAGCSAVFKGGAVTYCNEAKHNVLGVATQTLEKYTELSLQTVKEMAEGALKLYNTDFAASVSGVAGPDGGTIENPVGTVYVGFAQKNKSTITKKYNFNSINRLENINSTVNTVFEILKSKLLEAC